MDHVVPETTDAKQCIYPGRQTLYYLCAGCDVASLRSFARLTIPITLPGPGTAGGFGGRHDDTSAFYAYSSFNYPSTIFRYDIASVVTTFFRESAIKDFKARSRSQRGSDQQRRYPSAHASPVFKRLVQARREQSHILFTMAFNITVAPEFNPLRRLLEQGVA